MLVEYRPVIIVSLLLLGACRPSPSSLEANRSPATKAAEEFYLKGNMKLAAQSLRTALDKGSNACDRVEAKLLMVQMILTLWNRTRDERQSASTAIMTSAAADAASCPHPSQDTVAWFYLYWRSYLRTAEPPIPLPASFSSFESSPLVADQEQAVDATKRLLQLAEANPKHPEAIARFRLDLYMAGQQSDNLLSEAERARAATRWGRGVLEAGLLFLRADLDRERAFDRAYNANEKAKLIYRGLGPAFAGRVAEAAERQANMLIDTQDNEAAVRVLQEALGEFDRTKAAWVSQLDTLRSVSTDVPPLDSISKAIRAHLLLTLSRAELQAGRPARSIERARNGLDELRNTAGESLNTLKEKLSLLLALALQEDGSFEESEKIFQATLGNLRPSDAGYVDAFVNWAILKANRGDLTGAWHLLSAISPEAPAADLWAPNILLTMAEIQMMSGHNFWRDTRLGPNVGRPVPQSARAVSSYVSEYLDRQFSRLNKRIDLLSPRRRYGRLRALGNQPFLAQAILEFRPGAAAVTTAYDAVLATKGMIMDLSRADVGLMRDLPDSVRTAIQERLQKRVAISQTCRKGACVAELARIDAELEAMLPTSRDRSKTWSTARVARELSRIRSEWRAVTSSDAEVVLLDYSWRRRYDPSQRLLSDRWKTDVYDLFVTTTSSPTSHFTISASPATLDACAAELQKYMATAIQPRQSALGTTQTKSNTTGATAPSTCSNGDWNQLEPVLPPEVKASLKRLPPRSLVIVSPDRGLHAVPFTGLPLSETSTLIDRFSLSWVASARELEEFRSRRPSSNRALLVYDAFPGPGANFPAIAPLNSTLRLFDSLNAIKIRQPDKQSLQKQTANPSVVGIFLHGAVRKADPQVWNEFTLPEGAFLEMPLAELAVHGYSGNDENGKGALRGPEISGLRFGGTQIALMASCETLAGQTVPGEGPMAVARAVRLAGAESVTASLAKVDQNFTLTLIDGTTRLLLQPGRSIAAAEAFALATRSLKAERFRDPRYWAPHVFVGNPFPLNLRLQTTR